MGLTEASAFKDGKIVNDDVNASAAIAGTKISPNFGSQTIQTTGRLIVTKTGSEPEIELNGNGPNFIRFTDSVVASHSLDLIFRDSPNTLGIEKSSDGTVLFSVDNDDGQVIVTNNLDVNGQFKLFDDDNSHSIGFKAPATVASNVLFTLPATDAAFSGYALISDGAGTLSWGVAGGARGNGNNQIFWENDQTVTGNYTITNGKNAGSFGPITIQSGVTVTVGTGETWSVV